MNLFSGCFVFAFLQIMYMYYLLGWMILDQQECEPAKKQVIADNTYLLFLDGDVTFKPSALLLLVDLMKKNINVAAACGRVHPSGSGEQCVTSDLQCVTSDLQCVTSRAVCDITLAMCGIRHAVCNVRFSVCDGRCSVFDADIQSVTSEVFSV